MTDQSNDFKNMLSTALLVHQVLVKTTKNQPIAMFGENSRYSVLLETDTGTTFTIWAKDDAFPSHLLQSNYLNNAQDPWRGSAHVIPLIGEFEQAGYEAKIIPRSAGDSTGISTLHDLKLVLTLKP